MSFFVRQVMLYVDGMNGVMKHQPTMEWLYSLIASNYRSVVKTALKLLLVFVEYAESNCYVLVSAIHAVDAAQGTAPWANIFDATVTHKMFYGRWHQHLSLSLF